MLIKKFNWKIDWKLALIIILAVFSFALFGLGSPALNRDSGQFVTIADNILSTGRFSSDGSRLTSIREPGYPFFLASVFSVFGDRNYLAVTAIQLLLFICFIFYFYSLIKKLFPGSNWPLIAVAVAALFPSANFYNGQILSESLFTFFLGVSVLTFIDASRSGFSRRSKIIFLGIFLGLSALVRVEGLIAIAVVILSLLALKYFKQALAVLAIIAVIICPWMIRNYRLFHNFSLTNGRQEVQYLADATLISRAHFLDFPRVSWVRLKKGLRLPMSSSDISLEFKYNENDLMWQVDTVQEFFAEHPELAPSDKFLARTNPMEGYSQDGVRGKAFRQYSEKIILSHPILAAGDMFFNTVDTLGPELPTVVKDNHFFQSRLALRLFSVLYALFYLVIYFLLGLLIVKIISSRRKDYIPWVLFAIAAAILAGHSIFSFTTRFNTPLFTIYFILAAYYLSSIKKNEI